MTTHAIEDTYLLGYSATETERLIAQADFIAAFTRGLFEEAGISPGMRVLDIGSGAGDVAFLAADLVGPSGAVVGIDRDPAAVATARERARAMGRTNVTFVIGDANAPAVDGSFDAVVGRLVLLYQPDPVATLRTLRELVRPGGVIAFQEYSFTASSLVQIPPTALWQQVWHWMRETVRRIGLDESIAFRLYDHYRAAGLPAPQMRLSAAVGGGPAWGGYEYAEATLRSMLPLTVRLGVATDAEVDIDTLGARLRAETVAGGGVVKAPDLISAWTIVR